MTKTQAIQEIKAMGMSAKGYSETGEIRVTTKDGNEERAYYTTDAQDAVDTAKRMRKAVLGESFDAATAAR